MAIKFLLTGEGTSRTPPVVGARGTGQINQFKTDSDYVEDVELASIHCVLERLRAAINWGMAQTPLLFGRFPFHRFGGSSGWPKRARHLLDHVDKSRGRMSNARLFIQGWERPMANNKPNTTKTQVKAGYAPVNGFEMYYEIHGTGEPLLLRSTSAVCPCPCCSTV